MKFALFMPIFEACDTELWSYEDRMRILASIVASDDGDVYDVGEQWYKVLNSKLRADSAANAEKLIEHAGIEFDTFVVTTAYDPIGEELILLTDDAVNRLVEEWIETSK
jgi:hypothetical protein